MKLLLVLLVCAVAAAAPRANNVEPLQLRDLQSESLESRNIALNALIRQLFAIIRRIINNGWDVFGIPPLDPLELDNYHLVLPAGLVNLDLNLKDIHVSGIGGFVVHSSNLNLRDLTFDLDISVPVLNIRAGEYDLIGDLFTAIPLYGKGRADFVIEGFRFQARLILKQSDDKRSILIDRVVEPSFLISALKSDLTGVIGNDGDLDAIVNAMIEEVVFDYIHRFRGAIALTAASVVPGGLNPFLDQLDTWKYIANLIPRM